MRNNSLIIETEGEIQAARDLIKNQDQEIRHMRDTVKSLTKNMDNLELQIFYAKYMQGESLKAISKRLKYSYSHIKRISAKISRKVDIEKAKR
jgi:DNA-binding MarR family transcriptional regulator